MDFNIGERYVIPAQTGRAFTMRKNQTLTVVDVFGSQVADLFCADLSDVTDGLSGGRTIDYNESFAMQPGYFLYSHSGARLMEFTGDTSPGHHDLLVTPCSLQMFQMISGQTDYHPSCLENLTTSLERFGIKRWQITSTFNIFMKFTIMPDRKIKLAAPESRANDRVTLRACCDLVVALTACSDELTNNGSCKPVAFEISPA